jgi:hypothetical protein
MPVASTTECRIACICGVYRPHSHADVGIGKLLHGYPTDEGLLLPRVRVVSLYMDQIDEGDLGVATAAAHGIPFCTSIKAALTLGSGDLAVDGVAILGEHGDYVSTHTIQVRNLVRTSYATQRNHV